MKYILMMNTMKAGQGVPNWPQKDLQAHIAFMKSFAKDLHQSAGLGRRFVVPRSGEAGAGR